MKYTVTDDFKKGSKGLIAFVITAILAFPILHLIKGDFTWGAFFINAGLNIGIALVLGVFFFFGSQIPKNNGK